ncbi:MAG: peroxiredoxin [Candidatus Omnitrophota bacterium]
MSLVNKIAPDCNARAVISNQIKENFKLSDYRGKYIVLFFYPLDFTFVCPTEIHAFQDRLGEFEKRHVQVIGVSTDSWYTHLAWLKTPKKEGGIEGVSFPLVSDFNKTISKDYGILQEEDGVALRGLFLIDRKGIIQHETINNLALGRNVDEVLRMVDALQFTEKHGEVCPVNWKTGDKAMKPDSKGLQEYFKDAS